MKGHELRFRISKDLFKRYKIICAQLDLSIPKQGEELIKQFVDAQEENALALILANKQDL